MSGLNNNDIIRGKSKGYSPGNRQPPVYPHHAHQQVKTDQSCKDHSGMKITGHF